ncbi:hypothetical protein BH10ACT11_BH10ACT11_00820 [soil metagenome]
MNTNQEQGTGAMKVPRRIKALGFVTCAIALAGPAAAQAGSGGVGVGGGGKGHHGQKHHGQKTVAGKKAKLRHGKAIAPRRAPSRVKRAIKAANSIRHKPYKYGGGHARWHDSGYDCSGASSYVLGKYGARKLSSPRPSGSLMRYGSSGAGKWITVYANGGHAYVKIAGLRFDTSNTGGNGPRWSKDTKGGKVNGPFHVRHPGSL